MQSLPLNDIGLVIHNLHLSELHRKFLIGLMEVGVPVHLIESHSELLDVPDATWVRMCDDSAYYERLAAERPTAVAFFVTPLVQDLNIWRPDEDDKAQILEIKQSRFRRLFPEDYVDEDPAPELE